MNSFDLSHTWASRVYLSSHSHSGSSAGGSTLMKSPNWSSLSLFPSTFNHTENSLFSTRLWLASIGSDRMQLSREVGIGIVLSSRYGAATSEPVLISYRNVKEAFPFLLRFWNSLLDLVAAARIFRVWQNPIEEIADRSVHGTLVIRLTERRDLLIDPTRCPMCS